jgi:hypothetical protein
LSAERRGAIPRRPWRLVALAAAATGAVALAGCGEQHAPPVYNAINGYLNSLAAGNYSSACALLDHRARAALVRSTRLRISCAKAFHRCLPNRAQTATKDQTQLLYANLDVSIQGSTASAAVSGTPVARAVRQVDLAKERGRWKLTSYGRGLTGCRQRQGEKKTA